MTLARGYTIEVGCLVEIECGSGHCNFGDIIEKWSKAAGSGDYVWDDFYTYAEVGPRIRPLSISEREAISK